MAKRKAGRGKRKTINFNEIMVVKESISSEGKPPWREHNILTEMLNILCLGTLHDVLKKKSKSNKIFKTEAHKSIENPLSTW